MTAFVLVPGAWLGGWAWADVAAGLTAAGHDAHAVTLPGLAERSDDAPASTVDLTRHADDVAALVEHLDLQGATLVVHSYAGALAAMVADRVPQRLGRIVYLATQPVPQGMSLFDLLGCEAEAMMRAMAVEAGDPDRLPVIPDDLLDVFYPEHGLEGALLTRFRERATPHPVATQAEPVTLSGAGAGVPRTLLWCRGDGPSPALDDPASWTVRVLPTGHWPMLTHPDLLTSTLLDVAA